MVKFLFPEHNLHFLLQGQVKTNYIPVHIAHERPGSSDLTRNLKWV